MGSCGESRCCKNITELLYYSESEDSKIIQPNKIKKEAYNDKLLYIKYNQILNEIRENPSKFLIESKSYDLAEIFIKLKPSNPIKFSEENINNIISYLKEEEDTRISIHKKEIKIATMINYGYIKKICMYEIDTIYDDLRQNLWYFLQQNEDDLEQILSAYYEYIIILCLPLNNELSRLIFIFYNQT